MDRTMAQIRQIQRLASNIGLDIPEEYATPDANSSPLIGCYVVVRCHDAGVHAGVLHSMDGRSCHLRNARRLWYWKPANNQSFLSGVANYGLAPESKVGVPISMMALTENCEILCCTRIAEDSIEGAKSHVRS
jgi:hypothetical protein